MTWLAQNKRQSQGIKNKFKTWKDAWYSFMYVYKSATCLLQREECFLSEWMWLDSLMCLENCLKTHILMMIKWVLAQVTLTRVSVSPVSANHLHYGRSG